MTAAPVLELHGYGQSLRGTLWLFLRKKQWVLTRSATSERVLSNFSINIGVSGAMERGVRTLMRTKQAWFRITANFQFQVQFYMPY